MDETCLLSLFFFFFLETDWKEGSAEIISKFSATAGENVMNHVALFIVGHVWDN